MKKLLFILFLFSCQLLLSQDLTFGKEKLNYYLGFSLNSTNTGSLSIFVLLEVVDNKIVDVRQLTKSSFLNQAAGLEFSKANPKQEDFFKLYDVEDWRVVNSLWKLRYSEYPEKYPGSGQSAKGWSNRRDLFLGKKLMNPIKLRPSEGQMKFLRRYGIKSINNFFYGKKAFKLLHDMQDSTWIYEYMVR